MDFKITRKNDELERQAIQILRRWRAVLSAVSVVVFLSTSSCISTTMMTPAKQLEAGEFVVQGAIEEPGAFYWPGLKAQIGYGTGDAGDIGAMVGFTRTGLTAGLRGRLYLHENFDLELIEHFNYQWIDWNPSGEGAEVDISDDLSNELLASTLRGRVGLDVDDSHRVYFGPQVQLTVVFPEPETSGTVGPDFLLMGAFAGMELELGNGFGLQGEFQMFYPFRVSSQSGVVPAFGVVTVGVNYRF